MLFAKKKKAIAVAIKKKKMADLLEKYGAISVVHNKERYRNGIPTGEFCTVLFVEKKETDIAVLKQKGIAIAPKNFDVVEATVKTYHEKIRPLIGGLSIGVKGFGLIGTFGGVAYCKKTAKLKGVVNRHVIADTMFKQLTSPAQADITDGLGGTLDDFVIGVSEGRSEFWDVATITLNSEALINVQHNIGQTTNVLGELKQGLLVQKNGRTTGHTWGYVSHFVRIKHASLALVFENDVLIEGANMRFSDRGDSSSYIYDEFGNLVAILWGGLETTDGRYFTIAHPIKPIFEDLNLISSSIRSL